MRSPRRRPWVLIACISVMAGCVGDLPTGGGPPDARGSAGMDARPVDAQPIDGPAELQCRDKITAGLDTGRHNPGQNCQQGCHDHGFYMSGTLYSSAAGGQPVVGASITFIDANGMTGDMVSNLNGNFWWAALPVAFPVKIIASSCPDIQPMVAMVNASGAGCNQSGCHSATGGAGRIHLP